MTTQSRNATIPAVLAALAIVGVLDACHRTPARVPTTFEVHDAWVRATPDSSGTSAGYMTLVNGTPRRVVVSRFASDAARAVELHETAISRSGESRMTMADSVAIAPGDTLSMHPGGYHLMIIGTTHPLVGGSTIRIGMHLSDGSIVSTTARVNDQR